ncbi:hypothetical protein CAOG_08043 [Capsaspora owczarzaki ATCC 30864]|nr:hypothetical protein CAOG_08043 [Capsaspora owczarzaki ATCC 30864]|eukprot:XP_004342644.2 hypothetical protein CAOG_08043 [Capsaspora owczarzaki ATCC 30864]
MAANPAQAPFREQLSALAACLGVSVDLAPISELTTQLAQRAKLKQLLNGQQAGTDAPTDKQKTDAAAALLELELSLSCAKLVVRNLLGARLLGALNDELNSKLATDQSVQQVEQLRRQLAATNITGPSYPTDVRELKRAPDQQRAREDWPEAVDPVYPRHNTTKEILTEIHESFFGTRLARDRFRFLQVATMSGMGKTTYGANIITHLLKALENPAADLGFPEKHRSLLINLLTHCTQTVFIDFNGRGDGLASADDFGTDVWLAKRLAARGLLDLPIKRVRDLLSRMSDLDVKSVIRELWRRLRERQQIPDDEHALLIIHIDEYQLAHRFLCEHENKTSQAASRALADAFNEILACNMGSDENTVVVLLTATSTAGLTQHPLTTHRMKMVYLEPLPLSTALDLLETKWLASSSQLHPSWRDNVQFCQFVQDVGGAPTLLQDLSWHTQLGAAPGKDNVKTVLWQLAGSLQPRTTSNIEAFAKSTDNILQLADLTLTQQSVPASTAIDQVTIERLAFEGILTLAPGAVGEVVVGCPIPFMNYLLNQNFATTCGHAVHLFQIPFESVGDGDIFETAAHLSLTAHLRLLVQTGQDRNVASLLRIKNLTDLRGFAQATALLHAFSPSASYVPIIEDTQILSNSNSTFEFFTRRVQGRSPWSLKQEDFGSMASCVDTPASRIPVVQTLKNTYGVDMWVLLPAEHKLYAKTKPVLLLFQFKHRQAVSRDKFFRDTHDTIQTTLKQVTAGVTDSQTGETCDVLMVVMVSGTASQSLKEATRLAADRKWAKELATFNEQPDPRVIVLMGEDVRRIVPFMWSRFPDTGDWVVPNEDDSSSQDSSMADGSSSQTDDSSTDQ